MPLLRYFTVAFLSHSDINTSLVGLDTAPQFAGSPIHPLSYEGGVMQNPRGTMTWVLIAGALTICFANTLSAQDLLETQCPVLMRMAETYQQDLKAVDTLLQAALESGDMDRIKNYKLKKGVVQKQLNSVLSAIDTKGCAKAK